MSKRCELQKEYYLQFGNYKGGGKYNDNYVKWLESEVLKLNRGVVRKCQCKEYSGEAEDGTCFECRLIRG